MDRLTGLAFSRRRMDGSPVNEQFKGDKHWRSLMSMHATGLKLGLVTFSWLAVASLAQGAMRSETGARVTGPSWVLAQAGQAKPSASVPAASSKDIDGPTMFATLCGFCHENGAGLLGRDRGSQARSAATSTSSSESRTENLVRCRHSAAPFPMARSSQFLPTSADLRMTASRLGPEGPTSVALNAALKLAWSIRRDRNSGR